MRAARRSAVELRASKLMVIKRACAHGAWKVGRCGLWPAFSYGYAITGMSVAERTFARRVVFWGAPGFAAGRSTTITLALAGFDPAVEIDAGPIILLSDLAWEINMQRFSFLCTCMGSRFAPVPSHLAEMQGPHLVSLFCGAQNWVGAPP